MVLPSPYLEQAIHGFQQTLDNYRQVIGELEQALPADIMASLGSSDEASLVQALPLVISHMHDYFVHVAARMEKLHQEVSGLRVGAAVGLGHGLRQQRLVWFQPGRVCRA